MKKVGLYILAYFSALLASVAGLLFGTQLIESTLWMAALAVLALLPLLLIPFQMIAHKRIMQNLQRSKVADLHAFMVSHRNDAEKTAKEKLKLLCRIRCFTTAYMLLMALLAIAIAVLGGVLMASHSTLYTLCVLYSGLIFLSVYARCRKKAPLILGETAMVVLPNEYPCIHALVQKAANCVGCDKEVAIVLAGDCTASIVTDQKRAFLQIGVVLLNVLTEEELYAVLLHEFSHITGKKSALREQHYNLWLREDGGAFDSMSAFLTALYLGFDRKYLFHYMIYQYASSVIDELAADQAMAKHFDSKIAVSALLKTQYDTLYSWESGVKNEASIYEPETLEADYLTNRIALFKKAMAERNEFWNDLISKEILPNNATHPTLKMRMDALGVESLALVETTSSDAYLAEIKKLLEISEKNVYDDRIKTYTKDRTENYTQPLARIEAWKRAGCQIAAETYADLISDFKSIGQHEEAEALCDRVLQELPELSTNHAAFMKGAAMLCRYDEKGVDFVYRAMEQNGNYIEEGIQLLGTFCCLTGREEDLLTYRKKAAQLAQKHKDCDAEISYLSKGDNLTKETLPEGMLEEILAFIQSVDQGIIQNVYLVRKTVSDTFFASVFIIHFYGGTDAQREEIMHKIFCFLDSHPSQWQFSLFDYFDYPQVKVEKIAGSLVYTKENT